MSSSRKLRGRTVDLPEPESRVHQRSGHASSRLSTRSHTETFLVGYPSPSISGSQLPTNRQAFQYFLYLQTLPENASKPAVQRIAYETVDVIIPFWQMARIKTMTRQNAMFLFMKLHDKQRALMKNKGRQSDPGGKRGAFVLELDTLFDIGASDAIQEIRNNRLLTKEKKDEDIRFYTDQRTERKGHMNGHDKIFEIRALQQTLRNERLRQRHDQGEETETDSEIDYILSIYVCCFYTTGM
jgi:hypothetical protein